MKYFREIVFVDAALKDWENFLAGLDRNVETVWLDPLADGLTQIAAHLVQNQIPSLPPLESLSQFSEPSWSVPIMPQPYDAIHIISHGSSGQLKLGATLLNAQNLSTYQEQLQRIGTALTDSGDLLLYGCNVAEGPSGEQFIKILAELTSADVAASKDLTGAGALGGNWILEAETGVIETVSQKLSYSGVLLDQTGTTGSDELIGTNGDDFLMGLEDDDVLYGISGNDILLGGDGNDTLIDYESFDGLVKNNVLDGGAGDDHFYVDSPETTDTSVLTGGAGSDVYHLQAGNLSAMTATDFTVGDGGDVINISNLLSSSGFSSLLNNPFAPSLGYLRLLQSGNDTLLQWDRDGANSITDNWQTTLTLQNIQASTLTADNFSPTHKPDGSRLMTPNVITYYGIAYDGTVVLSSNIDDAATQSTPIEFSFDYFGSTFTSFWASTNGVLGFGTPSSDYSNTDLPNTGTPNNALYVFWDDLNTSSGNVAYTVIPASDPNNITGNTLLVVQWNAVRLLGGSEPMTFQAVLTEGSNQIQFNYLEMGSAVVGSSATVGIENADGTAGIRYSYNEAMLESGMVITYSPDDVGSYTSEVSSASGIEGLSLTGTADADILEGSIWADQLSGLGGNDTLYGRAGNDTLEGGDGYDDLYGGSGNDTLIAGSKDSNADTDGNRLYGEAGDDTLSGGDNAAASDLLNGGIGNDNLTGLAGNDSLYGEVGSDNLQGGDGSDSLYDTVGSNGVVENNTLDGGAGDDHFYVDSPETTDTSVLTGGAGSDVYHLQAGNLSAMTATDFIVGLGGDVIDINQFLNSTNSNNPFAPGIGYLRLRQDGADTLLEFDQDGANGVGHGWRTLLTLQNVVATSLTTENFSPAFELRGVDLSAYRIDENSLSDTVVGLLNVFGPDVDPNQTYSYTLVDDADGRFVIVGNQLRVANGSQLNFEQVQTHALSIVATATNGSTIFSNLNILLNNVNDTPTDLSLSNIKLDQAGVSNGMLVGYVSTSDPDWGDTFTYNLLDNAGGRFELAGTSLKVADASLLDYVTQASHTVTLQVIDAGGLSFSKDFTIDLERYPDLVVTQVNAPQVANSGDTIEFSWTVTNNGLSTASGSWTDTIYLDSPDTRWTDLNLGSFSYTGELAPGASLTRVQQVQLPITLSGSYKFVVVTDAYGNVDEGVSENNNTPASTNLIDITLAPRPNLQVSSVFAPDTTFAGKEAVIQWTVTNNGSAATDEPTWYDSVWLSLDDAPDDTDIYLGAATNPAYLNVGEYYTNQLTVKLPEVSGNYRFIVKTDAYGQIFEANDENDNSAASNYTQINPIPLSEMSDLIIPTVTSPTQAFSGQQMILNFTLSNQGEGELQGDDFARNFGYPTDEFTTYFEPRSFFDPEVVLNVYMSSDATLDNEDKLLASDYLDLSYVRLIETVYPMVFAVGGSDSSGIVASPPPEYHWQYHDLLPKPLGQNNYQGSIAVTLPVGVSGDFYYFVTAQSLAGKEVSTLNNVGVTATPMQVVLTPPPDLEVSSLTAPTEGVAGHDISVSYQAGNFGLSTTPNHYWTDNFYLSQDAVLNRDTDISLQTVGHSGALDPDGTYTQTVELTLPNGLDGTYYLIAEADYQNQVFELDNANNNKATAINIVSRPADLVVSNAITPTAAVSGQAMRVSWSVANQGVGDTILGYWTDKIILSRDQVHGNADDVVLQSFGHSNTVLNPGESYQHSELLALPIELSGNYFVFVKTDADGQVFEGANEHNNFSLAAAEGGTEPAILSVTQIGADLQVSQVSAPRLAQSGQAMTVNWTTTNAGTVATNANYWTDRVILSQDDILGNDDDILLDNVFHSGQLDANGSYQGSVVAELPIDFNGDYHVFVTTDANNTVFEAGNDGNNTTDASALLSVALSPMPDVRITNLDIPANGISGQRLQLNWTVTNDGAAIPSQIHPVTGVDRAIRRDAFYVSRDQVFDPQTDKYIGTSENLAVLDAGASQTYSATLTLPRGLSGNYYLFAVADSANHIYERGGENNNTVHSVAQVNLILPPPADLEVGEISTPTSAATGQNATVEYTVTNVSGDNALGEWEDTLYLSADNKWDVTDTVFARVQHEGPLASGASYTNAVTAAVPGVVAGDYHIIVRSDIRNAIPEPNEQNNIVVSTGIVNVGVETLTLGQADNGQIQEGHSVFYRIEAPAGESLRVDFDALNGFGFTELYVSYGEIPSRSHFDFAYDNPDGLDQSVIVPNTRAGSYYVMAYGEQVQNLQALPNNLFGFGDSNTADYTILADIARFEVSEIGTTKGSSLGETTIRISGTKFTEATDAKLVAADGTEVSATQVQWKDGTELWATFDLRGKAIGQYDVKVVDGGQVSTLNDAFNVTNGPVGNVVFDLATPTAVRPGQQGTLTVHFQNVGHTDAVAPVLQVAVSNAQLRLPGDAEYSESAIQFLAVGSEGPAGILSPGESGSITLMFKPTITTDGTINAGVSALDNTANIDWIAALANAKPEGLSAEGWNTIIANFTAAVGDTAGSYQAALADDANRLSLLGETTNQVSRLFGFEFAQATNALLQQNQLGVLGWGRSFNWDIGVKEDQDGHVELHFGASSVEFHREADGTYSGSDTTTLSKTGGAFTLRNDDTTWAFQLDGKLDYVDDANGNRMDATYSGGRLTQLATSTGDTLTFSYNADGRFSEVSDQAGRTTSYSYDASGEYLTDVTSATGTVHYDYVTAPGAAQHAVSAITYPDGSVKHFQYDSQGRLTKESLNDGAQTVRYAYDSAGGVTVTDADGNVTKLLFNDRGQIERIEDALHRVTQLDYDVDGNLTGIVNPDGTFTEMSYDALGNPLNVLDAMGNQVQFGYHPTLNALSSVKDQLGHATSYGYDENGNLQAITYADGSQDKYSYDSQGNLTVAVNQRGESVLYTYDSQGQLLAKTYADGSTANYAYDARGNLISASDADSATSCEYDGADRLTKVTDGDGRFLAYTFDADGHRASMTDQAGNSVHYGYNALGQLALLTDGNGNSIAAYSYDALGRLARGDNGNGTYTTYEYDAAGQLTHLVNYKADGGVNSRFDYSYDEAGNRTSMTTLDGTTAYEYDAIGQLTGVTLPEGRHIEYRYDPAGNRTQVIDSGAATDYSANELNQYTGAGSATFSYDADGNLIGKTENGVTTTYAYDVENRLVSVSTPTDSWSYEYDAFGNRVASVHNGERSEFQLDPTGMVNVAGEYDAAGNLLARYTHGLGLESEALANGTAAYYDFDAIGSTAGLTGSNGAYVNQYRYLPFGENLLTNEGVANAFEYVGQWGVMDEGNGLDFMRARYYSPTEGGFIGIDPIGIKGGLNVYAYTGNSPTMFSDPLGLFCTSQALDGAFNIVGGIAGIAGAAAISATMPASLAVLATVGIVSSAYSFTVGTAQLAGAASDQNIGLSGGLFSDIFSSLADKDNKDGLGALGGMLDIAASVFGGRVPSTITNKSLQTASNLINVSGSTKSAFDNWFSFFKKLNGLDYDPCEPPSPPSPNKPVLPPVDINVVVPRDPNDILGPQGFGDDHWVKAGTPLGYTIRFENQASATAPAQQVTITQNLDSDLDIRSFRLGDFGWGDIVIDVPENRAFYSERLDFTADKGFMLDVTAGIDVAKGQIFWTLTTIDPNTGAPPADPLLGFLPPNNDNGAGDGFVQYSVRADRDAPTGTRIDAEATIVFDTEAPIDTPAIFHTLDVNGPASQVLAEAGAAVNVDTPEFLVRWSGSDTGSALAGYTVYVSDNGGEYSPWLENTTLTEASYLGQAGHRYAFYSIASDNAGNREAAPAQADLTVTVSGIPLVVEEVTLPASGRYALGDNLDISVRFSDVVNVETGNLPPAIALIISSATASAQYLSGTGTNTLVFRHTVQATEYDADGVAMGDSIVLNDGSLSGSQGNTVELALGALNTQGIIINNAPQLLLNGNSQVTEGTAYQLAIQTNDTDTGRAGLSLVIDWADGSPLQTLNAADLPVDGMVSHTYVGGSIHLRPLTSYAINVTAIDPLGITTGQTQHLQVAWDTDGDGVADIRDNAILVANANQRDTDGDGYGNIVDPDLNNDMIINLDDLSLMKQRFFSADADADLDGNGSVNFADLSILKSMFFKPPGDSYVDHLDENGVATVESLAEPVNTSAIELVGVPADPFWG
jgi:RHS repeat-associated protein